MTEREHRLERGRARDTNRARSELLSTLSRLPENGLIFSRTEVDRIAKALGGYPELVKVVDTQD